jgi:hypothetical protein
MSFRDRFYTKQTAQVILSWRIAVGIGAAVALVVGGLAWPLGIVGGLVVYAGLVAVGMPKPQARPKIDPFTVGEPWRQFVQGAQRSAARLHDTISTTREGPLRDRMDAVAQKLQHGLDETFEIARRGDEIDAAVTRLDPTALRSKLATLQQQRASIPDEQVDAAIASVEAQLATTDRLKAQSAQTASTLRLTQTRLDELVARAAEVSIGAADTDTYEHDVDDLVVELEGLRLAVEETNRP